MLATSPRKRGEVRTPLFESRICKNSSRRPASRTLLRQGFGGHPASRSGRIQSCEAPWREAGWWGRKDSNLRSHEAADLQSAPFATRDTSPLNSITTRPPEWRKKVIDDAETEDPIPGSSVAAFMGESPRQSQPTKPLIRAIMRKLPLSGTRDTSGAHEGSRSKAQVPARRRQGSRQTPRIRPPAGVGRP